MPTTDDRYTRSVRDDADKAGVLSELRDAGFCFARGREWSPAAVLEWFRERGLVTGPFRSLVYTGPGEYRVREETG